jgi:hypothetical protein
VGSLRPAHCAYASVSLYATITTDDRPCRPDNFQGLVVNATSHQTPIAT